MSDLRRSIQRAVQLADRLGETPERDALVAALGALWTRERLAAGQGPALQAALAAVLGAVESLEGAPGMEALVSCVEDIERAVLARWAEVPVPSRRWAPPTRATGERPALHRGPELPFVARRLDEHDDDVEVREPTEEELLAAPVAPDAWFGEDEEPASAPTPLGESAEMERRMGLAIVDLAAPEPPPVQLAGEGGEPLAREWIYGNIVASCAEKIAALARDRYRLPWRERAHAERRILELSDAFAVCGEGRLGALTTWWQQVQGDADGWASWAAALLLGCTAGDDAGVALVQGTLTLPPEDRASVIVIAEALGVCPHPDLPRWALGWASSPHPVERALGVDVLSRLGRIDEREIALGLDDDSPLVSELAVRAVERIAAPTEALRARLRMLLQGSAVGPAWRAARLLTLLGDDTPYRRLREGDILRATLGALALEIFVLHGEMADRAAFAACHRAERPTPYVLDALARYGHAGAARYLMHFLNEEELAQAAERALVVLFGEIVPPDERRVAEAWRRAIAGLGAGDRERLRRGERWSAEGVVRECRTGALSEAELRPRLDELAMRGGGQPHIDLSGWTCDVEPRLAELFARFA